jgi:N-acetylglucosamine-6-phosphate deacetylase
MSLMKNTNPSATALLLCHARIVLPERVIERAGLLVEDGRIARLLESSAESQSRIEATLDLEGLTLFPGFIDAHIHGSVGVDTMEADADDLHRVAVFLAQNGVTGWLPTLVPAPEDDYRKAARAVEQLMRKQETHTAAARVLGLHYEGPFINSAQCGALRPAYFRTFESAASVEELATINQSDAVHMITIAPEIEGGVELVAELKRRGWVVSIGHTRAGVPQLDSAYAAGARHMTHFMNAMSPLHHRAPGPIGWGLLRDDVSVDIIADGIHVDPLVLQLLLRCKTPKSLTLISDAVAPAGLGDGEYEIWGETITVAGGRTRNQRGNIAGSVITMREAVRMMRTLDASLIEVAQMAATNAARLLGVNQECGSIEEGKRADLAALDAHGNVRLTLVGGRVAFDNLAGTG